MQRDSDNNVSQTPQKRPGYPQQHHAEHSYQGLSKSSRYMSNLDNSKKSANDNVKSDAMAMNCAQFLGKTGNNSKSYLNSEANRNSISKASTSAGSTHSNDGQKTFFSRTFERYNHDDSNRGAGPSNNLAKRNKMMTLSMLVNEDVRISKLLRRLMDENNPNNAVDLCAKLETAIRNQANHQYICRSFGGLAVQFIQILRDAPASCLRRIATIFGVVGYVNRADFLFYKNCIEENYASHRSIQKYLMISLKTTFSCDAVNKDLSIYSEDMLILLKDYLENADLVDNFMAVSETIVEFSKHYVCAFEKHFTDIVDIIIGWHVETEQPPTLKHFCSMILQSMSEYFVKELDFTFGLLGQFLEDIQAACEDSNNKSQNPELSVGAFVGAFNSIMKSLATPKEFVAFTVGKNLLRFAVTVITKAARQTLTTASCGETVCSVNEFFTLAFANYDKIEKVMIDDIKEILQIEIHNMDKFDVSLTGSMLFLALTVINQLNANTPMPFVTMLLKIEENPLNRVKLTRNSRNFKLLVKIYHKILMIKNVPLLLEAYKYILLDIEQSINCLNGQNANETKTPTYTPAQAECVLSFYFLALAGLATQTSSIIGMYALNPSILELLITNCQSTNMKIWSNNPTLHTALLSLLSTHCQKNHNYRRSSRLLADNLLVLLSLDESSPTAENFSRILQFQAGILSQASQLSEKNLKIILSWLRNLLAECKENAHLLKDNKLFIEICNYLCTTSILQPIDCAECIKTLQTYECLQKETLVHIRNVSIYHLQSLDEKVQDVYCDVFGRLPLNVSLLDATEELGTFQKKLLKVNELQQWYISTSLTASLREKYFIDFIENISLNSECKSIGEFSKDIFSKCWIAELREKAPEYYRTALGNENMMTSWIQWEAARYCVKNKLRTKLGKPQDTFLKIESIIMQYARVLALKDVNKVKNTSEIKSNQKHARVLLGFLECLEKCIYNASEGTAFALQTPEKPAKTFFRVNTLTCREWFNRIRTAVNLIAIHCMEPQMVIRYSESMLRSLIASGKINDMIFDHTIMSLVWALIKCKEPDTLQGLYVWIRLKAGKRYQWIKYASEHAAGHRQIAADGYASAIAGDEKLDSHVKEFLTDQLHDCLFFTNQWDRLTDCLGDQSLEKRETLPTFGINRAQLELLENLHYDYDASVSAFELAKWDKIENDQSSLALNFSSYKVANTMRVTLTVQALAGRTPDLTICSKLKAGLQECLKKQFSEHFHDFTLLNHVSCKLQDGNYSCDTFDAHSATQDSATLSKCVNWAIMFARSQGRDVKRNMFLDVAAVARKDGNHKLCRSELERFFRAKGLLPSGNADEIFAGVLGNKIHLDIDDAETLYGLSEMSKCLYTNCEKQCDAIALASACCLQIIEQGSSQKPSPCREIISPMLLTLSEWLPQQFSDDFFNSDSNSNNNQKNLIRLLDALPNITGPSELIPPMDKAVGKLIQASLLQCNYSGKSWAAFGNWCYRWGKKLVEAKTDDSNHTAGLTTRDIELIKDYVTQITDDDVQAIIHVLDKHQVTTTEDEDIETNEISSTELIDNQLRKIPILKDKSASEVMSIIQIWRKAHKNVYAYYDLAAEAYFRFLSITSNEDAKSGDCSLVTATLRLLRLIVKHALGLQEVLEEGLSLTPTRPWKVIVPQLFSRLNHHEPYVRKRVSELLCRVAEDTPPLIIFPAVVGAFQEHKKDEVIASDEVNPLTFCFNALLNTLSNQAPETVEQVQLLVRELRRVTLLWDEFWIHSLTQLYGEYSHLFNALELEAKKASSGQNNANLNMKHTILVTHIAEDLKKLFAVTSKPAETNYERLFQEKYSSAIENTIEELQKPRGITKINESWQKLKMLYTLFQQRLQKSSQTSLKMVDISPVLANMRNTAISMPGVETTESEPIFIKAVDNTVYILPTKTKPKKLAFLGSNGKRYTYLFKGLEDLHLDERIMQFLSISNSMMARSNTNVYQAHHYSVIPLGPQSGLISWVDGVTPLFGIYKKWQQREATSKDRQGSGVTRPSELFYSKLSPLLAERNIKVTNSRKTWPLPILRQVLDELMKETPRDLLARELWCHSDNCADWRSSIRKYSLSVAVMSVIGYVIGLGDRHLDNVLVNLSSGEIVHIDYNVCFEKGKTLRVPEKVPFRMTPNLEEALGITGIEGAFRLGCEHVLKTLRKERETLLTLLEAFVYDPLVDWAVGEDGNATSVRSTSAVVAAAKIAALKTTPTTNSIEDSKKKKKSDDCKKAETETTKNTILTRFTEIKPNWSQYRDEVICKIQQILNSLRDLELNRQSMLEVEMERDTLTKQLAMIRELETLGSAMGSHALNTISQRYSAYKKAAVDFATLKDTITRYAKEFQTTINLYYQTLLLGNGVRELNSLRQMIQCTQSRNEFDIIKDLLETSSQKVLYEKSDFARKEMDNTLQQQEKAAFVCIDALSQYAQVMRLYPNSLLKNSRLIKYEKWYHELLEGQKEPCKIRAELQSLANKDAQKRPAKMIEQVVEYATKLADNLTEANLGLRSIDIPSEQSLIAEQLEAIAENKNHFVNTGMEALHCLRFATLQHLADANDQMICFETSTVDMLDYQLNYIQYLLTLSDSYFEMSVDTLETLRSVEKALLSIRNLRYAAGCKLPAMIMELLMMTDDDIIDLLDRISYPRLNQTATFMDTLRDCHIPNLQFILNTIEEYFSDCQDNLDDVLARLKSTTDCGTFVSNTTNNKQLEQIILGLPNLEQNIFDQNQLNIMGQIFTIAYDQKKSLCNNWLDNVYDVRLIGQPIIQLIHTVQQNITMGFASLMGVVVLSELNSKYLTDISGLYSFENYLQSAKELTDAAFIAHQRKSDLQVMQMQLDLQIEIVEHITLINTAHFWANEEYLIPHTPLYSRIISRESLLTTIQNSSQSLSVWLMTMEKIQAEIDENTNSIVQRLKWSARAKETFDSLSNAQLEKYRTHTTLATKLIELSAVIAQFEYLKPSEKNYTKMDDIFLAMISQWEEASSAEQRLANITPTEKSIVQLLDPEGVVNQHWIDNISGLLDEIMYSLHRKIADLEKSAQNIQEQVFSFSTDLQSLMDTQLRVDIRHLLKLFSKVDTNGENQCTTRVREFQNIFKQFFAQLNDLNMKILCRDFTEPNVRQMFEQANDLIRDVEQNHTDLIELVEDCQADTMDRRNAGGSFANDSKKANQREQKRNAYAVSVWKRIRMKLEGRDPDPNRRCTVSEQVDYMIREATNPDNLAVLYEGWTPWV